MRTCEAASSHPSRSSLGDSNARSRSRTPAAPNSTDIRPGLSGGSKVNMHSPGQAACTDGSEAAQNSGLCFQENNPAKGGIRADPGKWPTRQNGKYQSLGLYNWSISLNCGSHEWRLALAAGRQHVAPSALCPSTRGHSRKLRGAGLVVVVPQRPDYGRYEGWRKGSTTWEAPGPLGGRSLAGRQVPRPWPGRGRAVWRIQSSTSAARRP